MNARAAAAAALAGITGLLPPAAAQPAAAPVRVTIDAVSCRSGRYAPVLPQHFPTLRGIGRHEWTELERRSVGGDTLTRQRVNYIGMRLELLHRASRPNAYELLLMEVGSRRWHVGALSVGRRPWASEPDPALSRVALDGELELAGPRDRAALRLRDGRIETVRWVCAAAD